MAHKKSSPLDEALQNLFSDNEQTQLAALEKLREVGNNQVIEPLMKVFASTSNMSIRHGIGSILSSVKTPGAELIFMDLLTRKEYVTFQAEILSFMWNSQMVPTDSIIEIVEIAIKGNYQTTLEALTLIENYEEPLSEDTVLEAISILQTEINASKDKDKVILLMDMMIWFRHMEERNSL